MTKSADAKSSMTKIYFPRAHSFSKILTKNHALAREFGPEKFALTDVSSFGPFTKSSRFFIDYHSKVVL